MNQPEDLLTDYLVGVTERLLVRAGSLGSALARKLRDPSTLLRGFLERQVGQVTSMRTLAAPDQQQDIRSLFVKPSVANMRGGSAEPTMTWARRHATGVLITGPAGTGKTLLLRSLVLETMEQKGPLPLYFELRTLNELDSSVSIMDAILRLLSDSGVDFTPLEFSALLDTGALVVFADGLDEVTPRRRPSLLRELRQLQEVYLEPEEKKNQKQERICRVVVTSRDELGFVVDGFTKYRLMPLTLAQASLLVSRLPIDPRVADTFDQALKDRLFRDRYSFASNPLLLTILVLTHGAGGTVPAREAEFYDVAYSALYRRHDALTKPGFTRPRQTKLDSNQFASVFSYYSMLSFDRRQFEFTEQSATDLASIALRELHRLDVSAESYIDDCVKAVCLLMEDGGRLVFSHRSFQEYFVARFLWLHAEGPRRELLLRSVLGTARRDKVLQLLDELAPEVVEGNLLLPYLRALRRSKALSESPTYEHVDALCKFCGLRKSSDRWEGDRELEEYLGLVTLLRGTGRLTATMDDLLPVAPRHFSSIPSDRFIMPQLRGDDYDRELLAVLADSASAFGTATLRELAVIEAKIAQQEKSRDDFLRRLAPRVL